MKEKEIRLEGIDPREFWGAANVNLNTMTQLSPKVKVIARGSTVKVLGDAGEVDAFEKRLTGLVDYFNKYHHISKEVVRQAFGSAGIEGAKPAVEGDVILFGAGGNVIRAKSKNQKKLVEAAVDHDLMFAVGPAGSGKTYTAIALAVRALKEKEVRRIILTRPAVEAGEKLGFLPGDVKEKLDPYLQPLYDALGDMMPAAQLTKYIEEGTVQIAPLAFMRGRTLDNAFVILDEAQNTTLSQIKMFLTRMGPSAKFIVTGDLTQIDLPRASDSGLPRALDMLSRVKGIAIVNFDEGDIIRHRLVKEIVAAFRKGDKEKQD
jgi:phosphate starvation-inducible PhoH-like protein